MVSHKPTFLILGVGGNVSQGILKALMASSLECRIVGACVSPRSMGLYVCDHALVSPLASDPRFIDWLIDVCDRFEVSGILSGVEPVLERLAEAKSVIEQRSGAKILVDTPEKLAICGDKLRTSQWLQANGLNYPRSAPAEDAPQVQRLLEEYGYPLFAKPRDGKGAQGVMRIESDTTLEAVTGMPNYVVQEYLGDASAEFTAATFTDVDRKVRGCIVFRRLLVEGTTVSAEVVHEVAVQTEVLRVAQALTPCGPCNMQLRMSGDRAVCFEINLRYSGTTPIRARFGFNDVEAGVRNHVLGQEIADLPIVERGLALRFWNEIYIEPSAVESLSHTEELPGARQSLTYLESFQRRS